MRRSRILALTGAVALATTAFGATATSAGAAITAPLTSTSTTEPPSTTILDTTIALQGQRLNETIFRLTAWAAILAVTTAVTGFFGQNIPYPGIEETSGFVASSVLLVGSVGGLYVYFKRKGWL